MIYVILKSKLCIVYYSQKIKILKYKKLKHKSKYKKTVQNVLILQFVKKI